MTVGYQVAEAIALHQRVPMKTAWSRAVEMLDRVRLPEPSVRAHSYPHQISGGQRQRVMIAMAFACNPEVVIADEPTTALDVTVQRQVLDLMLELRRERGTSILLITHDLGVVAETADRVMVMYAGKVVETGTVFEIFDSPRHPYTRALLASVPRLEGERLERMPDIQGQPPDILALPPGCPFQPRCPLAHDRCERSRSAAMVRPMSLIEPAPSSAMRSLIAFSASASPICFGRKFSMMPISSCSCWASSSRPPCSKCEMLSFRCLIIVCSIARISASSMPSILPRPRAAMSRSLRAAWIRRSVAVARSWRDFIASLSASLNFSRSIAAPPKSTRRPSLAARRR
jgi:oligopeptide/dipeptide ABC transporter ATP-binding protein